MWPNPLPAGKTKGVSIAAACLNSVAEPLRAAGIEVKIVVVAGFLAEEILDQSAQCHSDFIMLGSRGKSTQHLVSRQDALTGMLRHLKCPLIIVPVTGAT
jgi:nucleotide-binding universal stress UspA family protein